ncbi:MAG: dTDP-glucose 4,6-dehydratase [Deltaproteobacteria bacterium]|nr:dTDP-glucose 4,6-dehydratase [Deltaproteobacteria bacterium]MBW2388671.1 dTDP-glucose 4,6-dehydratase [Deltaproteobacteria bacterium]MBW2724667.1 dTDP-glucose 4,6-dehydratase [Deltaproteobacteria bacterium]
MDTLLVTGGAGFIGSNYTRLALRDSDARVVVLDKLTYAGNLESLADVRDHPRFHFELVDICDHAAIEQIFRSYAPTALLNFAAESHVDRSIDSPGSFIDTNIVGTFNLLDVSRRYHSELADVAKSRFRFLHVSTDEVYGTLGAEGAFHEETPYAPNSPYSASKAAADHLVRAYFETYGLPGVITNCSNNYGPYHFPEKLIPLVILNALDGKPLPIYGDGGNVRDWLYVEDHCRGIQLALEKGRLGEKYNIGGNNERTNLQIVDTICDELDLRAPAAKNPRLSERGIASYRELKTFVADRPGHDRRYAIDATKIREELGWEPLHSLETGLAATIEWYLENREWCEAVQAGSDMRQRLGLPNTTP